MFALIVRKVQWLIAGALAAGLTYSGAAAIHAMLLVWVGPGYGELDQQALLAILSTSCVIAVPLLNWSETLRTLGVPEIKIQEAKRKRENIEPGPTRTIIVYWAFLVTIGFMCVFVSFEDHRFNVSQVAVSGSANISCTPAGGNLNLSIGQDPGWHFFIPDLEFIAGNNCLDPCQGVNPLLGGAIFRTADDLKIPTQKQFGFLYQTLLAEGYITPDELGADVDIGRKLKRVRFFKGYVKYALFLFPYIILQGFWAIIFGRRRPRQVRDSVYLFIVELNLWADGTAKVHKLQIAKLCAFLSYSWAVVIAVICPPLFVINLIANEISVNNYPESENAHHVGAWTPYVATLLVFGAALVAKFHQRLEDKLIVLINITIGLLDRLATRTGLRKPRNDDDDDTSPNKIDDETEKVHTSAYWVVVWKSTRGLLHSAWHPIKHYFDDVRENLSEEFMNVQEWYREPAQIARHTDRHGFNIRKHDDCIILPVGQWFCDKFGKHPKGQFEVNFVGGRTLAAQSMTDSEADLMSDPGTDRERIDFARIPGSRLVRRPLADLGVIHPKSPSNPRFPGRSTSRVSSTAARGRYSQVSEQEDNTQGQADRVPDLPHAYKFGQATATIRERSISDISSRDDDHLLGDQDLPIQGPNEDQIHPAHRDSRDHSRGDRTRSGSQATTVILSPTNSVYPNPNINHGIAHELPTEYSKSTHNSTHTMSTPSDEVPLAFPGLQQSLSDSIQSRKRRSQQAYAPDTTHLPPTAEDPDEGTNPAPVRAPIKPPTSRYAIPPPAAPPKDRSSSSAPSPRARPISTPSPIPFISEEDIEEIGREHGPPEPEGSPNLITFSPNPTLNVPPGGFEQGSSEGRTPRRSTVSYLQVERPRTMQFDDVITLKKVDGVYRIVEPGEG